MGHFKKVLILLLGLSMNTAYPNAKLKIGIFDTTHTNKYRIQPFIDLSRSVGFDIKYNPISIIVDSDINDMNLDNYDGIFFIIGIEFLKGLSKSDIAHKILRIIKIFGETKKKLVGLFLPPIGQIKTPNKASIFAPFFTRIGLKVQSDPFQLIVNQKNDIQNLNINQKKISKALNSFTLGVKNFLNIPIEAKSFMYHTTLNAPKNINLQSPTINNHSIFATLPIKQDCSNRDCSNRDCSKKIKPTLPYGLYFYNPIRKNSLFISSSSILSFSGISENFHICPTDFNLRKQMHRLIQEMLWELKIIINNTAKTGSINYKQIEKEHKPELPQSIQNVGNPIEQSINPYKKIAWMDLTLLENKEKNKEQNLLIDSILKSGKDLYLWITINPQMYYSPIAKHLNKKNIFWKTITRFTKNLKLKAQQLKLNTPEILIGYEITNNIYLPNLPKKTASDIYGNSYFDIPQPLNKNFWKTEVIKPLEEFIKEWNKPKIRNGIKIAGIVLDLEMYCRKTTGSFLATMGFNNDNFKKFDVPSLFYLIKKKKMNNYFNFLEEQSDLLGKQLRRDITTQIPNAIISCYAPNIATNWFYKGFYKGLSTNTKPINLLTFNNEIKSHQNWLQQNSINANHSCVLMLSKIKNPENFKQINEILKHNNGIWFNKFSRFAEPKHKSWMSIEQSPMDKPDKLFKFIKNN